MARKWLAGLTALVLATSASAQTASKSPSREAPVWTQLERFGSEAEFVQYVREVQRLSGVRSRFGGLGGDADAIAVTGSQPIPPPPPPPPPPPSAPGAAGEALAATSPSPSSAEPTSITNVQTQGVDEGGIVKQVGRFLIVLQDGRLFVVDTRAQGGAGLALVGRTNVYRYAGADTWYDEMLTSGNRVLVAGYSYRERASEINVFSLDESGALTREATYYISSNDYYDIENYATRLVNGNLVIYTPLDVAYVNVDAPVRWPLVRRWLRDDERNAVTTPGRPLFDARDIYKPVQRTLAPLVHSVSVCPLGSARAGDELECHTTAFVGASQREFFVSTSDIYLWVTPSWRDGAPSCENGADGPVPATVFQIPLSGQSPRALHARGQPINQLALDASPEEFRALLGWNTGPCNRSRTAEVRYFHAPLTSFSATPAPAAEQSYVAAPGPGASRYEVRFTGAYVVYGAREGWGSQPPEAGALPLSARVVAIPLARPSAAATIEAPHNVIRVERAGPNIVLTGYRNDAGLSVSLLDLSRRPRIADTQVLLGRYESEGRSHAFNSLVGPEGAGLMGLPTVTRVKEGGRWWFRSRASDVSFLSMDAANRLSAAGELIANQNAQHPSYRCEVSCVDWYGNTRALFIGERVFALSATELIEGAMANGRVQERERLNLSAPTTR